MIIEHDIMWQIVRIGASTRRKMPSMPNRRKHPNPGFGHILDILAENDGVRQQQIAEMLHIRPQSVSEAIRGMELQGLVCRKSDEQDKRCTLIYITDLGLTRRIEAENNRIAKAREIFSCLTEAEKQTLHTLLHKVTDDIRRKEEVE